MASSDEIPIPLWKVLEAEFKSIHGDFPKDYEIEREADAKERSLDAGEDPGRENSEEEKDARRVSFFYKRIKEIAPENAALCFSGGGIRSATFNLGILQGLAKHGLLDKFAYLSTVSGGGFIGSWLSNWARVAGGIPKVMAEITRGRRPLFESEPRQIHYLRKYSQYLSPRLGILSADTWTLVSIFLRNLLLNWLVLIPLLLAILMIPRLCAAVVNIYPILERNGPASPEHPATQTALKTPAASAPAFAPASAPTTATALEPTSMSASPVCRVATAPEKLERLLLLLALAGTAWAFAYAVWHLPSVGVFTSSGQGGFLKYCWLPLVLSAMLATTAWAWSVNPADGNGWLFLSAGITLGIFGGVVGFLGRVIAWIRQRCKKRSAQKNATQKAKAAAAAELSPDDTAEQMTVAQMAWESLGLLIAAVVAGAVAGLAMWGSALLVERIPGCMSQTQNCWSKVARDGWETALYVCAAFPLMLLSLSAGGMVFVGLTSRLRLSSDADREWWSRFGAWVLLAAVGWAVASWLVLFGPALLLAIPGTLASIGGISGLITLLVGKSGLTPPNRSAQRQTDKKEIALQGLLGAATTLFLLFLVAALSLATDAMLGKIGPDHNDPGVWNHLLYRFDSSIDVLNPPERDPLYRHRAQLSLPLNQWHYALLEGFADVPQAMEESKESAHLRCFVEKERAISFARWVRKSLTAFESIRISDHWRDGIKHVSPDELKEPMASMVILQFDAFLFLLEWTALFLLIGSAAALLININNFSLHATDRDRLVRAYLGAARPEPKQLPGKAARPRARPSPGPGQEPAERTPNRFTGFDPNDDIEIHKLAPKEGSRGMLHVISVALNLTSGTDLAWQERKAESFTFSALHCGTGKLGYRDSRKYGGPNGVKLGTALTISGAAVSPNMGYHSSPVIAFLLTLFNVRLGAWLGNPCSRGKAYTQPGPRMGGWHLVLEALGFANDTSKFVYLSDGGHFDNLGLYEMVRRRCRLIIVCDGGQDRDYAFDDLANAIRKIHVDFGVPITFNGNISIAPSRETGVVVKRYCAIGKIQYHCKDGTPETDDGDLIYIKPAFYGPAGNAPVDVTNFAKRFPDFPHETTANQFFNETRFESYRSLGSHVFDDVQGLTPQAAGEEKNKAKSLKEFQDRVEKHLNSQTPGAAVLPEKGKVQDKGG